MGLLSPIEIKRQKRIAESKLESQDVNIQNKADSSSSSTARTSQKKFADACDTRRNSSRLKGSNVTYCELPTNYVDKELRPNKKAEKARKRPFEENLTIAERESVNESIPRGPFDFASASFQAKAIAPSSYVSQKNKVICIFCNFPRCVNTSTGKEIMRRHSLANESYCPGSNMPIADMQRLASVNVANDTTDLDEIVRLTEDVC